MQETKIKPKTNLFIGCNGCHQIGITLIKCKDSYYCPACKVKLGKEKFEKKGKK